MEVDNAVPSSDENEMEVKAEIKKVNAMFTEAQNSTKDKKRTRRDSSNRDKHNGGHHASSNGHGDVAANGVIKNGKLGDRKSRSCYGRGLPKKQGGGGKGTWGKPGEEILDDGVMDNKDPNYDSEEDDEVSYKPVVPEWSEGEITNTLEPIFQEYFEHGQREEVLHVLKNVNMSTHKDLVFVVLLTLAMEKKNEFRELASRLIDDLVKSVSIISPAVINSSRNVFFASTSDLGKGILKLVNNLPELLLDTPDADIVLGKFLARMIFQKTIGVSILDDVKALALEKENKNMAACEKEARILLTVPHYNFKQIWGVGGGNQPLEVLKKKMTLLLKEYLSSCDSNEAVRCVRDLDVPHFHHELIYEAIVMTIEISTPQAANMMSYLIKTLVDSMIVNDEQLNQALRRIYSNMPELSIDVPKAYHLLESFLSKLHDLKVIGNKIKMEAPNKTRKRFVSEGDHARFTGSMDYFDLV